MLERTTIEKTELDSEQLENALKAVRMVGHEMAQPLTISIGLVELLRLQTQDHSEIAEKLNDIYSQMNRLSDLTIKLMQTIPKLT
jgi:K+-sensing histidine kinase KdpD